jgi:proteasome lid subunit RPN8/RPN11
MPLRYQIKEVGGAIYFDRNNRITYHLYEIHPQAEANRTPLPPPTPRRGELGWTFHTHPGRGTRPSDADIRVSRLYQVPGIVVTWQGNVWGYDQNGYE